MKNQKKKPDAQDDVQELDAIEVAGDTLFIRFQVDGVPVPKGRPIIGKAFGSGRPMAYTPTKTRSYEKIIAHQANVARRGAAVPEGPVKVIVRACVPIPSSWSNTRRLRAAAGEIRPQTKPDLDNYLKVALDGINGVAFKDDNQVIEVRAAKFYSTTPRMEIEIYV